MITIENIKICKEAHPSKDGFSLKGEFEVIPENVTELVCDIVVILKSTQDEVSKKRRLLFEIVVEKDGKHLSLNIEESEYEIKSVNMLIVFGMDPLPLTGTGNYFIRVTDLSASGKPEVLYFAPLFRVITSLVSQAGPQQVYA